MHPKVRWKSFLPGENTRLIITAAFIGIMAGLAIIVFREAEELVHKYIFVNGYELLRIGEGGWRRFLLPLLPISGMVPCSFRCRFCSPARLTATVFPSFCAR